MQGGAADGARNALPGLVVPVGNLSPGASPKKGPIDLEIDGVKRKETSTRKRGELDQIRILGEGTTPRSFS